MDSVIAFLQVVLVVLLVAAPAVILIALLFRLRSSRARFTQAAGSAELPLSLRPPTDVEIAHEDTSVADEMPPEDLARLRDTGAVKFPE